MLYVLIILLLAAVILSVMIPVRKKQRESKHKAIVEAIAALSPDVEAAWNEICSYYNYLITYSLLLMQELKQRPYQRKK